MKAAPANSGHHLLNTSIAKRMCEVDDARVALMVHISKVSDEQELTFPSVERS